MNLTLKQAFLAMYFYLHAIYEKSKSEDLAMILSDMIILSDEMPSDPAAWSDWMRSIAKVKQLDKESSQLLTIKEAFICMRYYIEQLFNYSYSKDIQNIYKMLLTTEDGSPINELIRQDYMTAVHRAKGFNL